MIFIYPNLKLWELKIQDKGILFIKKILIKKNTSKQTIKKFK